MIKRRLLSLCSAPPPSSAGSGGSEDLEDPQAVSRHLLCPTPRPSGSSQALAPHSWDGVRRPTAPCTLSSSPHVGLRVSCLHPKYFPRTTVIFTKELPHCILHTVLLSSCRSSTEAFTQNKFHIPHTLLTSKIVTQLEYISHRIALKEFHQTHRRSNKDVWRRCFSPSNDNCVRYVSCVSCVSCLLSYWYWSSDPTRLLLHCDVGQSEKWTNSWRWYRSLLGHRNVN